MTKLIMKQFNENINNNRGIYCAVLGTALISPGIIMSAMAVGIFITGASIYNIYSK